MFARIERRAVVAGDKLINSEGERCKFLEHFGGKLAAKAEGEHRFTQTLSLLR
jgi:hypothetical protein